MKEQITFWAPPIDQGVPLWCQSWQSTSLNECIKKVKCWKKRESRQNWKATKAKQNLRTPRSPIPERVEGVLQVGFSNCGLWFWDWWGSQRISVPCSLWACMTRGVHSKIFHEPKPDDGRDRDLLPLPLLTRVSGSRCVGLRENVCFTLEMHWIVELALWMI